MARTDRAHRDDVIVPEMRQGVLRQGWGYDEAQDLRRIRAKLDEGYGLAEDEQEAWSRNRRLLPGESDGIWPGEWLVLPNLPSDGLWSIAAAGSDYTFKIGDSGDHGHRRRITLVIEGIDPHEVDIPAAFRRTTRCQRSMWNIDGHREDLESLLHGAPRRRSCPSAIDSVVTAARDAAGAELARRVGGAELEEPIAMALARLYPTVERRRGPWELGADLICESVDPVGIPSASPSRSGCGPGSPPTSAPSSSSPTPFVACLASQPALS